MADEVASTSRDPAASPRRLSLVLRLAILAIVPLVLVGPSFAPGVRFLPWAPVQLAPLASEYPDAAAAAGIGTNQSTIDRLFPALTDQLALADIERVGPAGTWEPILGLGLPLLGNAISGPFYPPNLLARILPPDRAAAPLALLALVWAGLGMWCLLARTGCSEAGCAVAALGLQAVGFGVTNLFFPMKVDAALWLPWALWSIEGLARGRRWATTWLGLSLGLPLLAGFPTIAVFSGAAAGLYALVRLTPLAPHLAPGPTAARGAWPRALLAAACAACLGLPQLVPTLHASSASFRVPKSAVELTELALPPSTTFGLALPDLYGSPLEPRPTYGPAVAWWTNPPSRAERVQHAQALEWNTYAGALNLLLALVALLAGGPRARMPWLLALLALGFAQGWPLVRLGFHLPGTGGGEPARALSVAWIAWPWAAGLGVDALVRRRPRANAVAAVGAVISAAAGAWLAAGGVDGDAMVERTAERHERPLEEARLVMDAFAVRTSEAQLERAGTVLLVAGLGLGGLLVLARRRRELVLGLGACALLVAEGGLFSRDHVRPRDLGDVDLFPECAAIEAIRSAAGGGRVLRIDPPELARDATVRLARPNMLHAYGISDLTAYVAFTPRSLVEVTEAVDPASRERTGFAALTDPALLDRPLWDLLRASAVLSVEPLDDPRLELVHAEPELHVYRRSGDLGPARVVPALARHPDRQALLAALAAADLDPRAAAQVVDGEAPVVSPIGSSVDADRLVVRSPRADRVVVELPEAASGALVVHAQHDRGWRARADGRPAEVFEADGALLGVALPFAARLVELSYRVPGLALSLWLAAGSLAVLVVAGSRRPRSA